MVRASEGGGWWVRGVGGERAAVCGGVQGAAGMVFGMLSRSFGWLQDRGASRQDACT